MFHRHVSSFSFFNKIKNSLDLLVCPSPFLKDVAGVSAAKHRRERKKRAQQKGAKPQGWSSISQMTLNKQAARRKTLRFARSMWSAYHGDDESIPDKIKVRAQLCQPSRAQLTAASWATPEAASWNTGGQASSSSAGDWQPAPNTYPWALAALELAQRDKQSL